MLRRLSLSLGRGDRQQPSESQASKKFGRSATQAVKGSAELRPLSRNDLEGLVLPCGAAAAAPGGGAPADGPSMVRYLSRDSVSMETSEELTTTLSATLQRVSTSRKVVEAAKSTLQREAEDVFQMRRTPSDLQPTLDRLMSSRR